MTYKKTSTLIWLAIALVISVAAMAIIGALTFSRIDNDIGMMGGGNWGMAFMAVPAVILILIVVGAIGGLDERHANNASPAYVQPQPSPRDILNQRLASGEIRQDEYDRIRTMLGQ